VTQAYQEALTAALAARQETFLARLPRMLKVGTALLLFVSLSSLPFVFPSSNGVQKQFEDVRATAALAVLKAQQIKTQKEEKKEPAPPPSSYTAQQQQAIAANDNPETTLRLPPAPEPDLVEQTERGALPRIGPDGQLPRQVYARPFNQNDPRPRIALVATKLGLSRLDTETALARLPPQATLVIASPSRDVQGWLDRARHEGFETLLSVPMEPTDFPRNDPGADTLLTSLADQENVQRLLRHLARGAGYVGVTTASGNLFTTDARKLTPVVEELHKRGLLLFDAALSPHSAIEPVAARLGAAALAHAIDIDSNPTPDAIDQALHDVEKQARHDGYAIVVTALYPVSLERIDLWVKGLAARGFALAPLSALVP